MAAPTLPSLPDVNTQQYFDSVLHGIGAPITLQNELFLLAWGKSENTQARYNPLATKQQVNGSTVAPGTSVQQYKSPGDGVTATVRTLLNGNYNNLVNTLRKGNVPGYQIVRQNQAEISTWGTNPTTLYNVAREYSDLQAPSNASFAHLLTSEGTKGAKAVVNASGLPQAAGAVEGTATSLGMYALYGLAMLGGTLVILTGFILIGADIGIAVLGRSKVARTGSATVARINPRARYAARESQANSELAAETKRDVAANRAARQREKLAQEKARTSRMRADAKRARDRNKPIGGEIPF